MRRFMIVAVDPLFLGPRKLVESSAQKAPRCRVSLVFDARLLWQHACKCDGKYFHHFMPVWLLRRVLTSGLPAQYQNSNQIVPGTLLRGPQKVAFFWKVS